MIMHVTQLETTARAFVKEHACIVSCITYEMQCTVNDISYAKEKFCGSVDSSTYWVTFTHCFCFICMYLKCLRKALFKIFVGKIFAV